MRFLDFESTNLEAKTIAELLVSADEILYTIQFGTRENAVKMLTDMIAANTDLQHIYKKPHLKCVFDEDAFVGVVITYLGKKQPSLERHTRRLFIKKIGIMRLLKRLLAYRKVKRVLKIHMPDEALYIYTLVINETHRLSGYGEQILDHFHEKHPDIYLHVNYKNNEAIQFYEKVGFEKVDEFYDCHNSEPVGALVLKRHKENMRGAS